MEGLPVVGVLQISAQPWGEKCTPAPMTICLEQPPWLSALAPPWPAAPEERPQRLDLLAHNLGSVVGKEDDIENILYALDPSLVALQEC